MRAEATASPDLPTRVVEGDELLGFRLIGADENDVQTDAGDFSARHQGLYAKPADAVIALRRDGFVKLHGERAIAWGRISPRGGEQGWFSQIRDDAGPLDRAGAAYAGCFAGADAPASDGDVADRGAAHGHPPRGTP